MEHEDGKQHERDASMSRGDNTDVQNTSDLGGGSETENKLKLRIILRDYIIRNKNIPIYRLEVNTNYPGFRKKRYFGVERTQVEFERLSKYLIYTYPEKLLFAFPRGSTKIGQQITVENEAAIKTRVQGWLDWMTSVEEVGNDKEVVKFVEAPFAFNAIIENIEGEKISVEADTESGGASNRGGGMGIFGGWGGGKTKKLHGLNVTYEDDVKNSEKMDEYFEKQRKGYEEKAKIFNKIRQLQVQHVQIKNQYCKMQAELGAQLRSLANIGTNNDVEQSLESLGKAIFSEGIINGKKTQHIASPFVYYIGEAERESAGIKMSLGNRKKIFEDYLHSIENLERKRQAVAILGSSSTIVPERVDETLKSMERAQKAKDLRKSQALKVNSSLQSDLIRYKLMHDKTFSSLLWRMGDETLSYERQVLAELKKSLKSSQHALSASQTPQPQPKTPKSPIVLDASRLFHS